MLRSRCSYRYLSNWESYEKVLYIYILCCLSFASHSQVSLISNIEEVDPSVSPPPTAFQINQISINFDVLKEIPEQLLIEFPDGGSTVVPLQSFDPRAGFYFRSEDDPPGPEVYPIPGLPDDEFSYLWTGVNDDYDVLLSVTNGQLTGLITGNEGRYGIERIFGGDYNYIEIRLEGYPSQDEPEEGDDGLINVTSEPAETHISHVKSFAINANNSPVVNRGSTTFVDLMVLWTEEARVDAGGDSNNANDTQDIEALMVASVDHTNLALTNSLTNTRVTKIFTAKLNGFVNTGNVTIDRNNFKVNTTMENFRNSVGADMAILIVGDSFTQCGIAYVQTRPNCGGNLSPGCDVGADFNEFSVALVDQSCAIFDDTFTHELGHLFGGNHVDIQTSPSYVQLISNNGFPEAFGKLDPSVFASIMSIDFNTSRRLYFSNPNVIVNGVPTGDIATMFNAKIIDDLSPAMSIYRDRPDLIFINGFE